MSNTHHDLTYISLGAGVQSSALLVMSALGLHGVPRADVAIFADTGDEPRWVYQHLARIKAWSPIPIETVGSGCISRDLHEKRWFTVPAFWKAADGSTGMLNRQCTHEYKLKPILRRVREIMGYAPGERVKHRCASMQGISYEELYRMRDAREKWITNVYPLVDLRFTRDKCKALLSEATGLPMPRRSACRFCPYKSDREWWELKTAAPDDFEAACRFDEQSRNFTDDKNKPTYMHRSCVPLREVDFDPEANGQIDMFLSDCEGLCGV